jgi:hypothetical protein
MPSAPTRLCLHCRFRDQVALYDNFSFLSAFQSAVDTIRAGHEPLPVHPPTDDGLNAAMADLAAAHSHAQAAADSHSIDVAHSAAL